MANNTGAVSQAAVAVNGDITSNVANFKTASSFTDRLLLNSANPDKSINAVQEDALTGNISRGTPSPGLEENTDSIEVSVPYTHKDTDFISADSLIAAYFGNDSMNDASDLNMITYDDLSIYALTLGYIFGTPDANGFVKKTVGAVPTSLELSASIDGKLTASSDFVAYNVENAGTADSSTIDSIPHTGHDNIMGHHMVFKIAEVGNSLAEKKITEFTLSLDRSLTEDAYATIDGSDHNDSTKIMAPIVDGRSDSTLDIEIPRYESTQFEDWANAPGSSELFGTIEFSYNSQRFKIIMPNIYIENVDVPLDGPDAITQSVSCILGRRDSLSSGKATFSNSGDTGGATDVNDAVGIEVDNARTSTIL